MRFIGAVIAALATFSTLSGAGAQSIASVGGPRELPPASFTGQQYVDSRGCVFLKAGYGGQVNWVPRVNAQRKALCGFPPTFAKVKIEIAEEAPTPRAVAQAPAVPAPPPRLPEVDPAIYTPAPYTPPGRRGVQKAPAPATVLATTPPASAAVAPRPTAPAPYTRAAPATAHVAVKSGPGPGKIGCFTSAPVAEVVRLRNGGTVVVCTRGDGGLSGWRAPIYPAGSPVGVALTDPVPHLATARADLDPVRLATGARPATTISLDTETVPKPPEGYKLAWTDDRLNPKRGLMTAAGQAAQDQVWTREVPARLVVQERRGRTRVAVSTKSEPATAGTKTAGTKDVLVQVGTFGVAGNAEDAAARLSALGLPVARGRTTSGGRTLQIVFAGPFAAMADAQAALSAARRAGFADAFLR